LFCLAHVLSCHARVLLRRSSCFSCSADHRYLHSFPTRRSSDLGWPIWLRLWRRPASPSSSSCTAGRGACCSSTSFPACPGALARSEEHTSELQSRENLVCRLLLEKKKKRITIAHAFCRRGQKHT